jgi:Arc/MetJ-type ribon-helix-helix transcriptional regulator
MSGMDVTAIRLPDPVVRRIDEWRSGRLDSEGRPVSRSAAIRLLLMAALDRDAGRRGAR